MPESLTLDGLFDHFEQFALVKGTTKKKCRAAFKKLQAWKQVYPKMELNKLGIAAWQKWLRDDQKMANASIRSYFGSVSQVFTWGVDEAEIIDANPFAKAKKIKAEEKEVRVWSQEEVDDFSDAAALYHRRDPSARLRFVCLIELCSKNGMRIGEVWPLRWNEDIDLENQVIYIQHRPSTPGQSYEWGSKGKKGRTVPILDDALCYLYRFKEVATWSHPFLKETTCQRMLADVDSLSEHQRTYPYCNFYRELNQIKDFANGRRSIQGKPPISKGKMHILRHTAATKMVEGGMDPKAVQNQLGHATLQTTMNVYVHANAQRAMQGVRNVYASK